MLLLSSIQSSAAAIAFICEAASEREACHCNHACAPTGTMHHQLARMTNARTGAIHSSTLDADSRGLKPAGSSCCLAVPQGDRPIVIASTQHISVETEAASLMDGAAAVAVASMRVHDPPDTRLLYVTNSCLLI